MAGFADTVPRCPTTPRRVGPTTGGSTSSSWTKDTCAAGGGAARKFLEGIMSDDQEHEDGPDFPEGGDLGAPVKAKGGTGIKAILGLVK